MTKPQSEPNERDAVGKPRVLTADRRQLAWRTCDLEATLPAEHRARAIWSVIESLDLAKFYRSIAARGSEPGRPAIDPKILLALWLYATSEGIGSAREVDRLCTSHDAYRWICGGVSVNYHALSDFRVEHAKALDELLTQMLAVLMRQGLVKLRRTAQDGMRVRASAGAASFRRQPKLEECLEKARRHVERMRAQLEEPDAGASASLRQRAAAERAARERQRRLERAIKELPKAQAAKKKVADRAQARVSTTDPEARVMKMGDGGYRPAYNVQLNTDVDSRFIVGVSVANAGTDMGQMTPMLEQTEQRTGMRPKEHLVDGGFTKLEAIEDAAAHGTTVYAPVQAPKDPSVDPHARKEKDTDAVAEWRARMATETAKAIYKDRAATAETVNADLRVLRGLDRLLVRGADKVTCVTLLAAVTYNVLRYISIVTV
jgi:transposase